MKKLCFLLLILLLQNPQFAQTPDIIGRDYPINTITTAVPFLLISPDPVGTAMGETGVGTGNDVYSMFWNPAKYAATSQLQSNIPSQDLRIALSYGPWLRTLVKDIWHGSMYASKLVSEHSAVSASFRYFSLGDITYTTIQGEVIGKTKPVEWAADIAYSQRLSEHWYGGVALRYIHSNLTQGHTIQGLETKPGTAVAADVSAYYERIIGSNKNSISFGASIANIGSKIGYYKKKTDTDFIPTILRIGPSFCWNVNEHSRFRFSFELDKLLVPTPPYYAVDSIGNILLDSQNEPVIRKGMSDNVSALRGMVQSFYDAPSGLNEEINEITASLGMEYRFYNLVFLRGGYFSEHASKGNRKYLTYGIGIKYKFIEGHISRIYDRQGPELKHIFEKRDVYNFGLLHKAVRFSIAFDLAGIYSLKKKK